MVLLRNSVTLFCLAAAANAVHNNNGKRFVPVQESSDASLEGPTSSAVDSAPAPATTAVATSSEAFSWAPTSTPAAQTSAASESLAEAPTSTDAPATTANHVAPMVPVVESSQTALQTSSPADQGTTGVAAPAVVVTESSEQALQTPTPRTTQQQQSQTWVYAPTTSEAPAVVAQTSAFTYAPSSAAEVPVSSSKAYEWQPTTPVAAEETQPTYTYAPASSSSNAAAVIAPIAVVSNSNSLNAPANTPAAPTSGNIPNFYQGPTSEAAAIPSAEATKPSGNVPLFYTAPPAAQTSASWAESSAVGTHTAASASEYNRPAQSASETGSVEVGTSKLPATLITPAAYHTGSPVPSTLATLSLSTQVVCPLDDDSCHTIVVTPRPATGTWTEQTKASSVSTDDGILVFNGKTVTMGGATLAAAPTRAANGGANGGSGAGGAASTTGAKGAGVQTGAAAKMSLGLGGFASVVLGMVLML